MMESLMKIPDDIFNQEILQYLTLDDIVKLDNACMNHEYRPQLLKKIDGVILLGDHHYYIIRASLFRWFGKRRHWESWRHMMCFVKRRLFCLPSTVQQCFSPTAPRCKPINSNTDKGLLGLRKCSPPASEVYVV